MDQLVLELSPNSRTADLLLPPQTGVGDRRLGTVETGSGSVDVIYSCTGEGTVTLLHSGGRTPASPCDSGRNIARLLTDTATESLTLDVTGRASWKVLARPTPADGSTD